MHQARVEPVQVAVGQKVEKPAGVGEVLGDISEVLGPNANRGLGGIDCPPVPARAHDLEEAHLVLPRQRIVPPTPAERARRALASSPSLFRVV